MQETRDFTRDGNKWSLQTDCPTGQHETISNRHERAAGPQMSRCASCLGLIFSPDRATWHLAGGIQDVLPLFPFLFWGSLRHLRFLQTWNDLLGEHVGQNSCKLGLSQALVCRGQGLQRRRGRKGETEEEVGL